MLQQEKLGKKLICADCNAKYYDLNRKNAQCPKCGCATIQTQKSKFKMTKAVEVDIDADETDFIDTIDTIDTDEDVDVEILPLDSLETELS